MLFRPAGPCRSAALTLLVLLFLGACGDGASREAAPAPTTAGTPAARSGGMLGGASAALSQTPTPARPAAGEPVSAITIVATDNAFAPSEFRVRAGVPFALTLENRGQAVHDWRVRGLADDQGRDAGTRLLSPGQSETVTLTIERAGEYALYCEVHAVDMRGKLTVQ
jgi:plastocyanin